MQFYNGLCGYNALTRTRSMGSKGGEACCFVKLALAFARWWRPCPYQWLFPCIVVLCCVGVYSVNSSPAAIVMTAGFAALGYVFVKLGCESAPFILGFVLGSPMEENLRRSMQLSNGDPAIFLYRPICVALIAAAFILLVITLLPAIRRGRDEAFQK
jgi:putative tricarboxylic transport membrane protein